MTIKSVYFMQSSIERHRSWLSSHIFVFTRLRCQTTITFTLIERGQRHCIGSGAQRAEFTASCTPMNLFRTVKMSHEWIFKLIAIIVWCSLARPGHDMDFCIPCFSLATSIPTRCTDCAACSVLRFNRCKGRRLHHHYYSVEFRWSKSAHKSRICISASATLRSLTKKCLWAAGRLSGNAPHSHQT